MSLIAEACALQDNTSHSDDISLLLRDAVDSYCWYTPEGQEVWAPYLRNGGPCLPDQQPLSRDGGGKASPEVFQSAAAYAYEQLVSEPYVGRDLVSVIRRGLVEGQLPDDTYNYVGVDCSGLVTQVLARALGQRNIDLYDRIFVPSRDSVLFTPDRPSGDDLARHKVLTEDAGLDQDITLRQLIDGLSPGKDPARRVSAKLLQYNSIIVDPDDDIRPGDMVMFAAAPGFDIYLHPTLVVSEAAGVLTLAHSTRVHVLTDIGGVSFAHLTRYEVFQEGIKYDGLGYPVVRRLPFLADLEMNED